MNKVKYFLLNGELYYSSQNISLFDIITYFNYQDSLFVLELNKLICNRSEWSDTFIQNHDQIEIVTVVGGG